MRKSEVINNVRYDWCPTSEPKGRVHSPWTISPFGVSPWNVSSSVWTNPVRWSVMTFWRSGVTTVALRRTQATNKTHVKNVSGVSLSELTNANELTQSTDRTYDFSWKINGEKHTYHWLSVGHYRHVSAANVEICQNLFWIQTYKFIEINLTENTKYVRTNFGLLFNCNKCNVKTNLEWLIQNALNFRK